MKWKKYHGVYQRVNPRVTRDKPKRSRTKKEKYCGVYSLSIAGRRYIGASQDIEGRWMGHLTKLRTGHHYNTNLQTAFNTHGEECIEWMVLQICPPPLLDDTEIAYISQYNSTNPAKGFNLRGGGKSGYSPDWNHNGYSSRACWISKDVFMKLRVAAAQADLRMGTIVETQIRNWLLKRRSTESK